MDKEMSNTFYGSDTNDSKNPLESEVDLFGSISRLINETTEYIQNLPKLPENEKAEKVIDDLLQRKVNYKKGGSFGQEK